MMKILRYWERAFYFSVKPSWEWFRHWWSFQQRFAHISAALPTTTKTSFIPGFRHCQGLPELDPVGQHVDQGDPQELLCGWQCQGSVNKRERQKRKLGGHPGGFGRGIYQQMEWNICVIQAPVIWGSGQEGKGMQRGEAKHELREGLWTVKRQPSERWREWQSREGWRADRYHSPGPQHRKSFIFRSARCQLPLSTPWRSHTVTQL